MSRPQVRKLMDDGKLVFRKVGSHHRVTLASVDAFLEAERRDIQAGMEEFSRLQDELGLLERVRSRPSLASCSATLLVMENFEAFDATAEEAAAAVASLTLNDEGDRHVITAAVAAEATFICSDDRTGFPADMKENLGIEWITADVLLSILIEEAPDTMLTVNQTVVSRLRGATDESTISALRKAKAKRTANLMEALLKAS